MNSTVTLIKLWCIVLMFREVLEDILFISKFNLWKINAMIIEIQFCFNLWWQIKAKIYIYITGWREWERISQSLDIQVNGGVISLEIQ